MISNASATNRKKPQFRIQVLNRQKQFRIDRKSIVSFCTALLHVLEQPARALSVVFVSAREMHSMNLRYLGRNYATDVLSFAYNREMMDGLPFLGEVVIAPEVAFHQAARFRTRPDREIRRLLVHGVLHLLGYDHKADGGRMNRLQAGLQRRKFFMSAPPLGELKTNG
jgi:probable rRNA maturation factor